MDVHIFTQVGPSHGRTYIHTGQSYGHTRHTHRSVLATNVHIYTQINPMDIHDIHTGQSYGHT